MAPEGLVLGADPGMQVGDLHHHAALRRRAEGAGEGGEIGTVVEDVAADDHVGDARHRCHVRPAAEHGGRGAARREHLLGGVDGDDVRSRGGERTRHRSPAGADVEHPAAGRQRLEGSAVGDAERRARHREERLDRQPPRVLGRLGEDRLGEGPRLERGAPPLRRRAAVPPGAPGHPPQRRPRGAERAARPTGAVRSSGSGGSTMPTARASARARSRE